MFYRYNISTGDYDAWDDENINGSLMRRGANVYDGSADGSLVGRAISNVSDIYTQFGMDYEEARNVSCQKNKLLYQMWFTNLCCVSVCFCSVGTSSVRTPWCKCSPQQAMATPLDSDWPSTPTSSAGPSRTGRYRHLCTLPGQEGRHLCNLPGQEGTFAPQGISGCQCLCISGCKFQ